MTQTRPVPHLAPARLAHSPQGTPFSTDYGDVYHSAHGALAQARHVFLAGNDLPARWQARDAFVIVETGFGLGHNFLAAWQAWREDDQRCGRLHFISVEKHPFHAEDLRLAHAQACVPEDLSQQLVARWPMLVPGFHRLEFDAGRVVLSLLFGDASEMLPACSASADAIFLDGFAPGKNPDMWSPAVFAALAGLAAPGTTLATWSVSAAVRQGLAEAGFVTGKTQGFSGKREMLRGHFGTAAAPGSRASASTRSRHALVIGAGLAGSGIAERLAARGWTSTVLEAGPAPAQGASGNLAGAFRPLPSADDNLLARLTRAGFLFGLQHLARLAERGHPVRWDACGVLHVARDAKQETKLRQTVEALAPPPEFVRYVDREEASALAGARTSGGAWWFARGGWIHPPSLCAANLAVVGAGVRCDTRVERIAHVDGRWQALDANDMVIDEADTLVLANAHDARRLAGTDWLPLRAARGQVSHLPTTQCGSLRSVVCGSGYVTPGVDGLAALGATFVVDDFSLELREEEQHENFAKLEKMLMSYAQDLRTAPLAGRASLRPISPDRLPMVGALPGPTGLWLLSGFGARGLVWGTLCAELLAAQICGEPLPLEHELVAALDPCRYLPTNR